MCIRDRYGATVLHMAQAPLGLWHLEGSMQVLSNQLVAAIERDGGTVLMKHRVTKLQPSSSGWQVTIRTGKGAEQHQRSSRDVVCSLPPQCLLELIEPDQLPKGYRKRLDNLHEASGARWCSTERCGVMDSHIPAQAISSGAAHPRGLCSSPSAARAMGVRPRGRPP